MLASKAICATTITAVKESRSITQSGIITDLLFFNFFASNIKEKFKALLFVFIVTQAIAEQRQIYILNFNTA